MNTKLFSIEEFERECFARYVQEQIIIMREMGMDEIADKEEANMAKRFGKVVIKQNIEQQHKQPYKQAQKAKRNKLREI